MTRTLLPKKYNMPSDLGRTLTLILNTRNDGLFWVTTGGRNLAMGAVGMALRMAGWHRGFHGC
jgi:hypothetical protein